MAKARVKRQYSIFEKQDGKWVRISELSFVKESAVRIFQNMLLEPFMNGIDGENIKGVRELRPVQRSSK
jgi:hypothetical protein